MVDLNIPRPDKITSVSDDIPGAVTLTAQLEKQGVAFTVTELPQIVGTAGNAILIHYVSPATGKPVTVLTIPMQPEIDLYGEKYFYFVGMDQDTASRLDWIEVYGACRNQS